MKEPDTTASLLQTSCWIGRSREHVPEFTPRSGPQDLPLALAESAGTLLLRRVVDVPDDVVSATLRLTARGVYVAYLGGRRVGAAQLAPTWTDYRSRYAVQEHDVATLLTPGSIVLGIELATGWYAGFLGMDRGHQARLYGDDPAVRAELVLRTRAGTEHVTVTDECWFVGTGATMHADMMHGQMIDPRRAPLGWLTDVDDPAGFEPARAHDDDDATLVPQTGPDIVVTERLRPVAVHQSPAGATIVDVGQNIVGRVRLRVPAATEQRPVGSHVHLRHGEALDDDGELYTENLRWATAHDIAVVTEQEWDFDPDFTFHGFRYVEITGFPGDLVPDDVEIAVLGPAISQVGVFDCSATDVVTLHDNILRTVRNNLVGAPTDCPQRDERLGWMGDANVISATMLFAYDLRDYLASWLVDVRSGQHENGAFPDVAPRVVVDVEGSPGWADAGVLLPWRLHRSGGHRRTLAEHYPAMVRFMQHLERENPDHYRERRLSRSYGDWLHLDDPTDKPLFATAYWALCADAMAAAAEVLDHPDDIERWRASGDAVRRSWWERHGDAADGSVREASQTALAMALSAELVPAHHREVVAAQLRERVLARGSALSTGIHGTRFLLPALSDSGSLDLAYDLLLRRSYPSWLYAVDQGATTIWERWDGWTQEAGFQTPFMNSLNHYAFGSVGEWLHEYVAGLRPGTDGYRRPAIRPYPGGGLTHAHARHDADGGAASSSWRIDGDRFVLEVSSAAGCRVSLPVTDPATIDIPVGGVAVDDGWPTFDLPPGTHTLSGAWDPAWSPPPTTRPDGWV